MSDRDPNSVLARMIAAHRGAGSGQVDLVPGLQKGLGRAIRRAGIPFVGLAPQVAAVSVVCEATLGDALLALPEHGLLAGIEDADGRRGLIALDHPLVDSLIEVQATSRVEDTNLPPRAVTRIDEALCRDFLDLVFGAFAQETADQAGRDWPDRMSYGSLIADRAQLNLLLPERGYHLLKVSVTAGGRKTGDLVLLLPTDTALARRAATPDPTAAAVNWSDRMLGAVASAPIVLDAVLMRVTLPLGEVEAWTEGELVPFDHSDLASVMLEDEAGHVFARGALGQLSGRRAVRLGGAASEQGATGGGPGAAETPRQGVAGTPVPAMAEAGAPPGLRPPQMAPSGLPGLGKDMMPAGTPDTTAPMQAPAMAGMAAPVPPHPPELPMGGFDPDAPMGGFDPDAPMG